MIDDVDGIFGQYAAAAASAEPAGPRFSLRQAADKLFKQVWSKVAPKQRKLVIRPGAAADRAPGGPSVPAAATVGSSSTGSQRPGQAAAARGAAVAGDRGPARAGASEDAIAAYCLVDLSNVEVLAGQMMRVKAAAWRVSVQLVEVALLFG
jgi:hypothetical protein